MAQVWDSDLTDIYETGVMLALANHADDEGRCYPSVERISKLARCSVRKAQEVVKSLSERGYIRVELNTGPRGCNTYFLTPTPAQHAPPHDVHPAQCAPPPRTVCTSTPAQHAPEPSVTINEPSVDDKARAQKMRLPEDWVPDGNCVNYALSKQLTPDEIQEIADDFHAYWTDRTDAGGRKSERGWQQAWRNRVRDQAPKFIRNRGVAFREGPGGRGQGGGIAGAVARRRAQGSL
jgi:hypothetical protein